MSIIEPTLTARTAMPSGVSLLFVATVSSTVGHFLRPYAEHFRRLGWRVDAAANGASKDPSLAGAFDHTYELALSRSIFDLDSLRRGAIGISNVLTSRPDIVHVHTPIASFITRFAVSRVPIDERPSVAYTAHGFHFHRGGSKAANGFFLTAEKLAGRWTDRLIVINDEDDEAARRNRIVAPNRLVRMPGIGIDTEAYSRSKIASDQLADSRQQLLVGSDAPLFVTVGELNRNKRQADVIAALARLRHSEAILVLVGTGQERTRLESLASGRGLRNRVRFAGFVEDVRPLVAGATAVILASGREGLARSIMEALALEVPVIASTARGNRELVDSDCGLMFRSGDVRQLAKHMDWLIDHPAERLEMGRRGRERMVERYDLHNLMLLHEDMYREMLEERGGQRE
jgi:glycosyltransferase involved in cell wall biosynthesis